MQVQVSEDRTRAPGTRLEGPVQCPCWIQAEYTCRNVIFGENHQDFDSICPKSPNINILIFHLMNHILISYLSEKTPK